MMDVGQVILIIFTGLLALATFWLALSTKKAADSSSRSAKIAADSAEMAKADMHTRTIAAVLELRYGRDMYEARKLFAEWAPRDHEKRKAWKPTKRFVMKMTAAQHLLRRHLKSYYEFIFILAKYGALSPDEERDLVTDGEAEIALWMLKPVEVRHGRNTAEKEGIPWQMNSFDAAMFRHFERLYPERFSEKNHSRQPE